MGSGWADRRGGLGSRLRGLRGVAGEFGGSAAEPERCVGRREGLAAHAREGETAGGVVAGQVRAPERRADGSEAGGGGAVGGPAAPAHLGSGRQDRGAGAGERGPEPALLAVGMPERGRGETAGGALAERAGGGQPVRRDPPGGAGVRPLRGVCQAGAHPPGAVRAGLLLGKCCGANYVAE